MVVAGVRVVSVVDMVVVAGVSVATIGRVVEAMVEVVVAVLLTVSFVEDGEVWGGRAVVCVEEEGVPWARGG